MTREWLVTLTVACVAVTAGLTARPQDPQAVPGPASIVGAWTIDKDQSDQPGGGRGSDDDRPMGGRGGGGAMRPGGMGGGSGRPADRDKVRRSARLMQDLVKPPDRLTIVRDGGAVLLTTDDGRTVRQVVDGKEQERLSGDGVIKSKSRWNGAQLVIEEKIQDGPKVTRTYTPSADGRQLMTVTRIEGGGMPGAMVVHHMFTREG
ncbi:MAG: hypothetical protein Q7V01_04240 [Vicinamibacterales bacterium]|nr:hypothetical protein [Vicinamibacterales bacterium]